MRVDAAASFMAEVLVATVTAAGLLVLCSSCPGARAEPAAVDAGAPPSDDCAPVLRQLLDVQRVAIVAGARASAAERVLERERLESAAALEHSATALRALAADVEALPEPPSRLVWLSAGVAVGAALALLGSSM